MTFFSNTDNVHPLKTLPNAAAIQAWIVNYLAELLEVPPDEVDTTLSFSSYGLDSSASVVLIGELEDWLERDIDVAVLHDCSTPEAVAQHLASQFDLRGQQP